MCDSTNPETRYFNGGGIHDLPLKGIAVVSGNLVEVFAESKIEHEGKILEKYLYNYVDYTPMNGQPYASLKENITLV